MSNLSNEIEETNEPTLRDWLTLLQTNRDTKLNDQIENINAAEQYLTTLFNKQIVASRLDELEKLKQSKGYGIATAMYIKDRIKQLENKTNEE